MRVTPMFKNNARYVNLPLVKQISAALYYIGTSTPSINILKGFIYEKHDRLW